MTFVLVSLADDPSRARDWLREIEPLIATTKEVEDAYDKRKEGGHRAAETWTGIGITYAGLEALKPGNTELRRDLEHHVSFQLGPHKRAEDLGDLDRNAPRNWLFGGGARPPVHAVVTVAADRKDDLLDRLSSISQIGERHDAQTVSQLRGRTLANEREHFGFKDGISQPGVEGFHHGTGEPLERTGYPGTLLVKPGEFVLGWPGEDGTVLSVAPWLRNASFQVLRRLDQDVERWRAVARRRDAEHRQEESWAARQFGRRPDGTPLAAVAGDQDHLNAFDYGDDQNGKLTPLCAHIRKVFPRGDPRFSSAPSGPAGSRRRRLIRRGIPFGKPFEDDPSDERGLIFNAFMASIEGQFEYVQRNWANKHDVPERDAGVDTVIGGKDRAAQLAGLYSRGEGDRPLPEFVHTRGAVYALALAKPALTWLADAG